MFFYDRLRFPQVNPIQPQSQFTGTHQEDARKYIFTDAWTVSSKVINDFRLSFSRLNGPNTLPPSQFANFPNVEIDPFGSNLGPYSLSPQGYVQNVYQAVENVSYIRGKHTFKFGVEGRNYITETTSLPRARGEWDYASLNSLINDFVPDGANERSAAREQQARRTTIQLFTGSFKMIGRYCRGLPSILDCGMIGPECRVTKENKR